MCTLQHSYKRYWNKETEYLKVGHHQSLGIAMKTAFGEKIQHEWTMHSIKRAVTLGIDLLVLNVQVTKNLAPIIYYGSHIHFYENSTADIKEKLLYELTLEQLQTYKLQCMDEDYLEYQDHSLFIPLSDVLDQVDSSIDFAIQVHWPVDKFNNDPTIDINIYIDCILEEVFKRPLKRRIIFSSSNSSICALLQYKQNIFPTTLVFCQNERACKSDYSSFNLMVAHATAVGLLGITVHDNEFLSDLNALQKSNALDEQLVIFVNWREQHERHAKLMAELRGIFQNTLVYFDRTSDPKQIKSVWVLKANDDDPLQTSLINEFLYEAVKLKSVEHPEPERYIDLSSAQGNLSTATSCNSLANLDE
jgi:glycerophosphoryl diester phosphodiesterase